MKIKLKYKKIPVNLEILDYLNQTRISFKEIINNPLDNNCILNNKRITKIPMKNLK